MFWYLLVIPAAILLIDNFQPQNGGFDKVDDNSPVFEKGADLYQHSDGRYYKNDWAINEDDL